MFRLLVALAAVAGAAGAKTKKRKAAAATAEPVVATPAAEPTLAAATPEPAVAAAAAPAGSSKITAVLGTAELAVATSARLEASKPIASSKLAFPATGAGKAALAAADGQYLHVAFDVTDGEGGGLTPHQAFVRLTNTASGSMSYFVAAPVSSGAEGSAAKPGAHAALLDLSDRKALHGADVSGTYAVDVLVGDEALANPTVWSLGNVQLTLASPSAKPAPPLYSTPLLYESDIALAPLKTITHQFRAPETRPPAAVSTVFVGALLAVFAGWLLTASRLGLRWSLPAAALPWALGFHGSFAGILLLFAAYWVKLTMFMTVGWLAVLAVPAAICGRQVLAALQARDAAAEEAAAKTKTA